MAGGAPEAGGNDEDIVTDDNGDDKPTTTIIVTNATEDPLRLETPGTAHPKLIESLVHDSNTSTPTTLSETTCTSSASSSSCDCSTCSSARSSPGPSRPRSAVSLRLENNVELSARPSRHSHDDDRCSSSSSSNVENDALHNQHSHNTHSAPVSPSPLAGLMPGTNLSAERRKAARERLRSAMAAVSTVSMKEKERQLQQQQQQQGDRGSSRDWIGGLSPGRGHSKRPSTDSTASQRESTGGRSDTPQIGPPSPNISTPASTPTPAPNLEEMDAKNKTSQLGTLSVIAAASGWDIRLRELVMREAKHGEASEPPSPIPLRGKLSTRVRSFTTSAPTTPTNPTPSKSADGSTDDLTANPLRRRSSVVSRYSALSGSWVSMGRNNSEYSRTRSKDESSFQRRNSHSHSPLHGRSPSRSAPDVTVSANPRTGEDGDTTQQGNQIPAEDQDLEDSTFTHEEGDIQRSRHIRRRTTEYTTIANAFDERLREIVLEAAGGLEKTRQAARSRNSISSSASQSHDTPLTHRRPLSLNIQRPRTRSMSGSHLDDRDERSIRVRTAPTTPLTRLSNSAQDVLRRRNDVIPYRMSPGVADGDGGRDYMEGGEAGKARKGRFQAALQYVPASPVTPTGVELDGGRDTDIKVGSADTLITNQALMSGVMSGVMSGASCDAGPGTIRKANQSEPPDGRGDCSSQTTPLSPPTVQQPPTSASPTPANRPKPPTHIPTPIVALSPPPSSTITFSIPHVPQSLTAAAAEAQPGLHDPKVEISQPAEITPTSSPPSREQGREKDVDTYTPPSFTAEYTPPAPAAEEQLHPSPSPASESHPFDIPPATITPMTIIAPAKGDSAVHLPDPSAPSEQADPGVGVGVETSWRFVRHTEVKVPEAVVGEVNMSTTSVSTDISKDISQILKTGMYEQVHEEKTQETVVEGWDLLDEEMFINYL
ncbi:uncharacterized protein EV422DRAFT_538800 [Fimicolochytrium jonesii]|uniref:uncharacterized protein n=1 Tax=Fimicolochytrium jonesii TaxID=1396493 RepID=UPI0022FE5B5B|nr:uncharacterized protein EV422DRAFT_538800 [Fimicolochytrium jonesii]KAI8818119.1 hypothetical protein EV422DRAFT_538800 [Fimicolochytrium jonesii]